MAYREVAKISIHLRKSSTITLTGRYLGATVSESKAGIDIYYESDPNGQPYVWSIIPLQEGSEIPDDAVFIGIFTAPSGRIVVVYALGGIIDAEGIDVLDNNDPVIVAAPEIDSFEKDV